MYVIYMLRCQDDSLYTGITTDLARRIRQHCGIKKGGAKYTKSHPPVSIAGAWRSDTRQAASQFEYYCKRLTHAQKNKLADNPENWRSFFPAIADQTFIPITILSLKAYLAQTDANSHEVL